MTSGTDRALRKLLDKAEIEEALLIYARGVDRGDWDLVRSACHPDAYHDHILFRGDLESFITYAKGRLASASNGMHLISNRLIEFMGDNLALAETYYLAQRQLPLPDEQLTGATSSSALAWCSWGRYLDRFERRDGAWRLAYRELALDTRYTVLARDVMPRGPSNWGRRDFDDPYYAFRRRMLGSLEPTQSADP